ncbi:MAG: hypothetical protein U9N81_06030 [Bacillota bacterium]|nr:hypothetical protein [Bacillota bacterium]
MEARRRTRQNKSMILDRFFQEIEHRQLVIEEFDESLWLASISKVTVMREGKLIFTFKDGTEIEG